MTNALVLNGLWWAALALPMLVFALGDAPGQPWRSLLAAIIAVGSGWLLLIAYAVVANAAAVSDVRDCDELLRIHDGDGAPMAFAAVFGWLPAAVTVAPIAGFRRLRRTR